MYVYCVFPTWSKTTSKLSEKSRKKQSVFQDDQISLRYFKQKKKKVTCINRNYVFQFLNISFNLYLPCFEKVGHLTV